MGTAWEDWDEDIWGDADVSGAAEMEALEARNVRALIKAKRRQVFRNP